MLTAMESSLVGLTAFARAAASGSYTSAARLIGISPSAVSKAVQRLERQLGVRLFNRTTRSLSLTAEGQELFERCQRLLQEVEDIEATVALARSEPAGRVVLAAPLALGRIIIAPALARFRAEYPKVEPELRLADRFVDLVDEGIDLAVRIGNLADSRLVARRLTSHRNVVCAAPLYLARKGAPERPDDLFEHDCIGFRLATTGRMFRWPLLLDGKRVELAPPARLIVDDGEAMAAVAVEGAGIALLATYIAAPFIRAGTLVPLLPDFAVEHAPVTLVLPESRRLNPAVRALIDLLVSLIPPEPEWDRIALGRRA